MKEAVVNLFQQHPELAIIISLSISVLVAIVGVVPSFFITAANIFFFGFWQGVMISFAGEALGAMVAFMLYRKGFKKTITVQLQRFPKAQRLVSAEGGEAFLLVLSLRLIPFVPSGLVTFAAAVGRIAPLTFFISSSLGKLPALLLEGYSVYEVTRFSWPGKVVLAVVAVVLIWWVVGKGRR